MNHKKLLLLAFDSADIRWIREWSQEGCLPNFARVLENSFSGEVINPPGFEAGAVWANMYTGHPVTHHGMFEAARIYDPVEYTRFMIKREDQNVPPFWKDLDRSGHRVLVLDVPYVHFDPELNGTQIAEWATHLRVETQWLLTNPPELAEEIERKYGRNPFESEMECPTDEKRIETEEDARSFREKMIKRARMKTDFICDQIEKGSWDLFVAAFHELHDTGHLCWHIHDETHEYHDRTLRDLVGDPVKDLYIELDQSLGRILDKLDDDTSVIVYCSHGMGAERTGTPVIGRILRKLEKLYLGSVRYALRREVESIRAKIRGKKLKSEASRMFFPVHANNATGCVRFNLKGRESRGKVKEGSELEALKARLKADLSEVKNLETGEPLIEDISFTDELYPEGGPKRHLIPDMCLEWNKSAPIRVVGSPKIGTIKAAQDRSRVGDHVFKRGCFFAMGSAFSKGHLEHDVLAEDIAPTIVKWFDCPTDRFSGRPIEELL